MPSAGLPVVGRRVAPGKPRELSEIAIYLDPPAGGPPSADDRAVSLIQRARERGVTTFDVGNARFPARAERLLARAFPTPDPSVCAIVARSVDSLARERSSEEVTTSSDLASAVRESLEESRRRLEPVPIGVVEWDPGDELGGEGPAANTPTSYPNAGPTEPLLAIELPRPGAPLPVPGGAPSLFSGSLSLLETDLIPAFEEARSKPGAALIAHDPFAGGRLDGSRFEDQARLPGPGAGPADVRRLHEEFDPVLRLGFLTQGHRRTLAQAALQFVLEWSWVVTAVVPLPSPERFDEILGYASRSPLTEDEIRRIGSVK